MPLPAKHALNTVLTSPAQNECWPSVPVSCFTTAQQINNFCVIVAPNFVYAFSYAFPTMNLPKHKNNTSRKMSILRQRNIKTCQDQN